MYLRARFWIKKLKKMREQKLILDLKGMTLLGNALLFRYCAIEVSRRGRKARYDERLSEREERDERRGLTKVLDLAGVYDARISDLFVETDSFPRQRMTVDAGRFSRLKNSEADIATLRLKDLEPSEDNPAWSEIQVALETATEQEQQVPLAQLEPSQLTRKLTQYVTTFWVSYIANGLGLSPAQAKFIGMQGVLVQKQLERPITPEVWFSKNARKIREEGDWLNKLRIQAEQLILDVNITCRSRREVRVIAEHRPLFSVRAMCRCLRLHPSGFYSTCKR